METAELESSLEEVKKNNEDIFKLIGNILIKTDKESVEKDLNEKIVHIKSRLRTYEVQEKNISKRISEIRGEMLKDKKKE